MTEHMRVCKTFYFHAAHRDEQASDKCGRLHGHTYKLEVKVTGKLDEARGMMLHADILKNIYRDRIEPKVEHQYLNDSLGINATMENVAKWIRDQFVEGLFLVVPTTRRLDVEVRLWETPTMYAEVPG